MRTLGLALCTLLMLPAAVPGTGTALAATTATNYTVATAHLQDDHVNGVFLYDTSGETSVAAIGFDANWRHGIAKTAGDPTVNPSSHITLSGTQTDKDHRIRVTVRAGGVTGTATFRSSLDAGATWSSTTYTTSAASQSLLCDGTDTGLDIAFATTKRWTANDVFTVLSWWAEGAGTHRSSTRDFPARAAIVVTGTAGEEDSGGVEIIDTGDDSVWMRFENSYPIAGAFRQNIVGDAVYSVAACWGAIVLSAPEGSYMRGVCVIDMVYDAVTLYDAGGADWDAWYFLNNIAQRNDGDTDGTGPIGWHKGVGYPRLTSQDVNGVSPVVVGNSFYLAVATGSGIDLIKDLSTVHSHATASPVTAVTVLADDLYYADGAHLYAKYAVGGIGGDWSSADATYDTASTPDLIDSAVNSLAGRAGASTARSGDNRLYVATDGGLTVLEEDQALKTSGTSLHYGASGSSNPGLDYKVLAGGTDAATAVAFAQDGDAVYVGTGDGAGGGAVSALKPYVDPGDTPRLYASYRTSTTPPIVSNDVAALSCGGDLLVGTAASGVTALSDAPTAVELLTFSAALQPGGTVLVAWETASEIDVAGFNVWRAPAPGEEYLQVNERLIPGAGDPVQGASYAFADTGCGAARCFYKLQEIDTRGTSVFHGPVPAEPGPSICGALSDPGGIGILALLVPAAAWLLRRPRRRPFRIPGNPG